MQILGLADSTPRTESRWRALFWPTIRSEGDFDYVSRQGFWVCVVVGVTTLLVSLLSGALSNAVVLILTLVESGFYLLAALGIRERSRLAAAAAFYAYLMGCAVNFRYSTSGFFGVTRIFFLALLLATVRGCWLADRWIKEKAATSTPAAEPVFSTTCEETWRDKLVDRVPSVLWPKLKYLFYPLAFLEFALLLFLLVR